MMSSEYEKKLRQIRVAEGLTQVAFAELTGINIGSIRNYENGKRNVGLNIIDQVLNTKDFKKYTLWLMTGETSEVNGQIAPSLSPDGQERTQNLLKVSNAGK
ncbi:MULTISPECIES: helix-turn-helix transcriptional regulator [Providencia]|uniref:helix-turn-helix domain-containing protein n=1 Tax=Providencia TaxID=586 RepID=UPI002905BE81|nr:MULTISPECIES: helix-turn-helix transcriptional regulator [Providencia]